MKSQENYILPASEVFFYTPSVTAMDTFFYPVCTGHFYYEAGYRQQRNSYDSFLLMYIASGEVTVEFDNRREQVVSEHFVLLDCYKPHGYHTQTGWESLWIHFDGPMARAYYDLIQSHLGNIFSMHDSYSVLKKLQQIYDTFANNAPIKEPLISKQLTDILTAMLLYSPMHLKANHHSNTIEEIVTYITEHFTEDLSVEDLADRAMLSHYHFIRIFKKETGFTPHEYIINLRLNTAKYLLKTTELSIKDICFHTGFSCESVFCAAFKKNVHATPTEYRRNTNTSFL